MKLAIKTKNIKEYKQAIAYLYAFGLTHNDNTTYSDHLKNEDIEVDYKEYPYVLVDTDDESNSVDFSFDPYPEYDLMVWIKDHDKIEKALSTKRFKMKLTEDYDAEVDDDGIHVGCQTISFDSFYALFGLVNDFNNQ